MVWDDHEKMKSIESSNDVDSGVSDEVEIWGEDVSVYVLVAMVF